MREWFRRVKSGVKEALARLSFRQGVIVLITCLFFYVASFAQMLLPISASAKGVVWFVLFGLAKLTQYLGLAIVGVEGWRRIKAYFKRNK